jgi:hypothetical protein
MFVTEHKEAMAKKQAGSGSLVTYRFGFRYDDIHAAARAIRPLLRIRWKKLNDKFWGGDHYLKMSKTGVIIKLHHNYEPFFDHWLQPEYKEYPILLFMQYPPGEAAPDQYDLLALFMGVAKTVIIPANSDAWDSGVPPME